MLLSHCAFLVQELWSIIKTDQDDLAKVSTFCEKPNCVSCIDNIKRYALWGECRKLCKIVLSCRANNLRELQDALNEDLKRIDDVVSSREAELYDSFRLGFDKDNNDICRALLEGGDRAQISRRELDRLAESVGSHCRYLCNTHRYPQYAGRLDVNEILFDLVFGIEDIIILGCNLTQHDNSSYLMKVLYVSTCFEVPFSIRSISSLQYTILFLFAFVDSENLEASYFSE